MSPRPLHAVRLPAVAQAGRLLDVLAAALDGTGPAVLPVDPRLPPGKVAALLRALGPDTLETEAGIERLAAGNPAALAPG
jgi:O-succinylbenzoic acid--CoA ligase